MKHEILSLAWIIYGLIWTQAELQGKATIEALNTFEESIDIIKDSTESNKLSVSFGGALRFNYNLSTWKPNQVKRGGDFGFEVFRITVDATYKKWEFKLDQRFYSAEFGGAFLKYGWFQYNLNDKSHLKLGLIPAYFGAQQFNSHSWFPQLPFFLGFEDDHDMGLSYDFENDKIQLDLAFYKNAEQWSFSDNDPISDARYNYDFSGRNKEVNQFNIRFNYKIEKTSTHKVGCSGQYGGIWNLDTKSMGNHLGLGLHYEANISNLNIKAQYLTYNNQPKNPEGESRDWIEMTAYGFPYHTAAKASICSISLAYTIAVEWGPITSLQIYDGYSYMDKVVAEWEDTQMNVFGILLSAKPLYVHFDYASGLHQPWLGPQWTDALSSGDPENNWESRFNVNLGFYF